ncbi:hypothetical protein RHSIM_Rhsim01G0272700 [Rhododendron simsii]|uniref:NAB domain-containing protein n=1 Tax=Rhododendron simsii TaxID=118357 RepID=A0A834HGP9_RHOSS|nr:hypothetical protein RHSIM_Rhsim01G0272700 [Rhododendron simsii]
MASFKHPESRRMYSWWWDSHISPKNSKWLQENLTDMDAKVKAMIKLIEEDADSFARRAEMYYKKRPELMKLVEEFYRAYRALAERYDNATGVLRQAHKTMAEVFPNQGSFDDSETDPRTPDMPPPMHAFFDPDDLHKDASGLTPSPFHALKKNGPFTDESDSVRNRKGLKQFNDIFGSGRVRKGLNFHEAEETMTQNRDFSESVPVGKCEKEIQALKETLAKLEAEKDAGLAHYQQSLEKLSELESNISRAQEDSKALNERANIAEGEVQTLKEALAKLEAEKEASLTQYQQCLERIANLENILSHAKEDAGELKERALKAENEAQALKQDLDQQKQSLETISSLENKLLLANEDAKRLCERANKAEMEVETIKQTLVKLTEEKESAAIQYQKCLETISSLESKIIFAQEEAKMLNGEIESGVAKLKGAEEQCALLERSNQSLHSELETLVVKVNGQSEELTEKQKELGRLWACLQEERLRFVEAETAFQTLQHLHCQTQEEMRILAAELQSGALLLRDAETHNCSLKDEAMKLKEENKSLNEINLSSTMSIKDMQNEIFGLRDTQGKLQEEVELRVDQRNALQQEIYCLKEELKELNRNHQATMDQVKAVGFSTENFESSVKELQGENGSLKEKWEIERSEKVALLEKLEVMEQLFEKNALLEKSLSDASAELETAKSKIIALEESLQSLLEEKSNLVSEKATVMTQLQMTTENLGKLSEENAFLGNSLSDAQDELEGLKIRSKSLEDLCQLLENEKSGLIHEKVTLVSQVEMTRLRLEDLDKRYRELEEKYSALEEEKESKLREIEELRVSLDLEKQENSSFAQMSETQLAFMTNQICLLQEEGHSRRRDFEEELDKSMKYQLEIFILQRCVRDLEQKSQSLSIEFQKLLEESKLSEKLISELERENLEQQVEVKSLSDQTSRFRIGMFELLRAFNIHLDHGCEDKIGKDQTYWNHMLSKLEDTKNENQQLAIEMSVLLTVLGHLELEATTLETERNWLDKELGIKNEQLSALQFEANKLLEMNEELRLKLRERDQKEKVLTTELENLHGEFSDMHGACQNLQKENLNALEEKRALTKELSNLEGKNRTLEGENFSIIGEILSLSTLSLIFQNVINEKSLELKEVGEDLDKLHGVNSALEANLRTIGGKLVEVENENFHLKERLKNSEDELRTVRFVSAQLNDEIASGKNLLSQKDVKLLEAEHKLTAMENEKSELQKEVEDMKMEHDEVTKCFGEVQISTVLLAVLEGKVVELTEACKSLEDRTASKDAHIELLEERKSTLEGENGVLKAQLAAYAPAINSLKDCISSLENLGCLHRELQETNDKKVKDTELASHHHVEYGEQLSADQKIPDELSELLGLQKRVKVVEKALIKIEKLVIKENISANTKLEAAMRQIEELKLKGGSNPENVKRPHEISESENGLLTKDIVLDQISECSSYGVSKRERLNAGSQKLGSWDNADSQRFESWDAADVDGSIDLTVGKGKQEKGKKVNSEIMVEKELGVDKLEIARTFSQPRREINKTKVLERLNSDVQRLTNLQITVQDLKRKMEITEKGKKGKEGKDTVDRDTLKEQLVEAEEAIMKFFDLNGKLMKSVEDGFFSAADAKPGMDSEESGNARRRRISEQARRVSEKIGRLQLEVQKIQFVLLKLDDESEKELKAKARIAEAKRRILLRDYLYGGGRNINKKKRSAFCACVQPSTRGD